jgi:ribosomal protein L24
MTSTRKIKKGDRVVVTRGGDIGIVGIVDRFSTSTARRSQAKRRWVHLHDCHLEGPLDGDPVPDATRMVEVEEVYLRDVVTTGEYRALLVQRREMIVEQERKWTEYETTRREEKLAAYIAQRVVPVGRIAYREDRDEETGPVRRIYFDPFSTTTTDEGLPKVERDRITIYNRDTWDARFTPEVTVNWSALGSVTPDEAFAFAQALQDAALRAMVLRAENEKAFGITERVRAALDAR